MDHGFTHYWNRESCNVSRDDGGTIDWLASSLWERAGVGPGDVIYPVTITGGRMFLIGRMIVERIVSRAEAIRVLGTEDIWDAPLVALARAGTATTMRHSRQVPLDIVKRLKFTSGAETRSLILHGDDIDQQTLRGVRRLTDESRDLLEALLAGTVP